MEGGRGEGGGGIGIYSTNFGLDTKLTPYGLEF